MPNWCLNKLTVSHTDKSAMDRFVAAYNKGQTCQEFIPEPANLKEDNALDPDGWYMWRIRNWHTKWDIGADEDTDHAERYGLRATVVGNEASCSFDSAWSPPIGLYNKLVELGYKVQASYFEPGMSFCGIYTDGHDNYIEYHSKDEIPVAIWNDFGLESFFEDEVVES